ncbi:hypothetical protein BT67DRAFT_84006 [Trichocladium antarcticum]|uniref:Uncharacterized protein n=1 Tax=Trichocladium antarcticum TaxID=1450529 RepID=A0AAN6ZBW8_9PEZI|nr:hypothetical protein BT67DRAFT_84006 [Trichocladium antarcticum]
MTLRRKKKRRCTSAFYARMRGDQAAPLLVRHPSTAGLADSAAFRQQLLKTHVPGSLLSSPGCAVSRLYCSTTSEPAAARHTRNALTRLPAGPGAWGSLIAETMFRAVFHCPCRHSKSIRTRYRTQHLEERGFRPSQESCGHLDRLGPRRMSLFDSWAKLILGRFCFLAAIGSGENSSRCFRHGIP